jgi:hypothetical protein
MQSFIISTTAPRILVTVDLQILPAQRTFRSISVSAKWQYILFRKCLAMFSHVHTRQRFLFSGSPGERPGIDHAIDCTHSPHCTNASQNNRNGGLNVMNLFADCSEPPRINGSTTRLLIWPTCSSPVLPVVMA